MRGDQPNLFSDGNFATWKNAVRGVRGFVFIAVVLAAIWTGRADHGLIAEAHAASGVSQATVIKEQPGPLTDRVNTVAGEAVITDIKSKDGAVTKGISLNGKSVYDQNGWILTFEGAYEYPGKTVLLVSTSDGGTACPSKYLFLTIRRDGTVGVTDEFGTCSDLPTVTLADDRIMVSLPDMQGQGNETWAYANEGLSKTQLIDPSKMRNAPRLTFKEDESVMVRGTLVQDQGLQEWRLKLSNPTLLDGYSGRGCAMIVEDIPIFLPSGVALPKVQGENDFMVTILCPSAGAMISSIALPGAAAQASQAGATTSTPQALNSSLSVQTNGIDTSHLQLAGGSAFASGWYWWTIAGVILTLWLPVTVLKFNFGPAAGELANQALINRMLQKGEYNPQAAAIEGVGLTVLIRIIFLVVGPLMIWFSLGKPLMHESDGSLHTLCCVNKPKASADGQLVYDLYRDDPGLIIAPIKTILFGDSDGEWKLRVVDVARGQYVNLDSAGTTEDGGRTLVLGKYDYGVVLAFDRSDLLIVPDRYASANLRPPVRVPASKFGMAAWPDAANGDIGNRCVSREEEMGGGVFGLVEGLFKLVVASKPAYDCAVPGSNTPSRTITVFDGEQPFFSTKDSKIQVIKAGGYRLKFIAL